MFISISAVTPWNTSHNVGPKILFLLVSFLYPEGFKVSWMEACVECRSVESKRLRER